jgi:hypothetical protein
MASDPAAVSHTNTGVEAFELADLLAARLYGPASPRASHLVDSPPEPHDRTATLNAQRKRSSPLGTTPASTSAQEGVLAVRHLLPAAEAARGPAAEVGCDGPTR